MSDNWITLVPDDPRFVPDLSTQTRARNRFVEVFPEADEIDIEVTDKVVFFDCGGNFERIICSSCGADIPMAWWRDRMEEDYDDGFKLTTYATPCCRTACTLHELTYEWPQSFGRFALNAMNPKLGELDDKHK